MNLELSSGDIKLRNFRKSDSTRMAELANNANISRNLRDGFPHPYTLQHAEEFIDRCMEMDPPTASAALELACDYGFRNLDVVRIHAGVYDHNLASQKVLEKCGFVKEGVFAKAVFKQEKFWNEVRYAKLQ